MDRPVIFVLALMGLLLGCSEQACELLPHELYIWQRVWTPAVVEGVRKASQHHIPLVLLAAQISKKDGQWETFRVDYDKGALQKLAHPVGLAIRIDGHLDSFDPRQPPFEQVTEVAGNLLRSASEDGIKINEIQIDLDCPTARLGEYASWLAALRPFVPSASLTLTVLPTWLSAPEMKSLLSSSNGYVLQVHSFEVPKSPKDKLTLCVPQQVMGWAKQAEQFGIPYRIALPTYGYLVAFDSRGKYLGIGAEGPMPQWPGDVKIQEVWADPDQLAEVVRSVQSTSWQCLRGLIWFRMPTEDDRLNWSWTALMAVMQARPPREDVQIELRQTEPELVDVFLINTGERDIQKDIEVRLSWHHTTLLAADGLGGFIASQPHPRQVVFEHHHKPVTGRILPQDKRQIGWLRFFEQTEVDGYVKLVE